MWYVNAKVVRQIIDGGMGVVIVTLDPGKPVTEAISAEFSKRLMAAYGFVMEIGERFKSGDSTITLDEFDKAESLAGAYIAGGLVKIIETMKAENPHIVPFPIAAFHKGNLYEMECWFGTADT